jgi:alpha-mannosidase
VEHGPVVSTIEVTHVHGDSRIMQRFSLYASLRRVDVHVTVDWHERHTILKLRFPLNLDFRTAICEIPFGCIERGFTGEEESGQTWMDCSGQLKGQKLLYGLSIANDCKHSMDFQLDTMDLTVLRSPIYAHHDPMAPDPEAGYLFQDQGVQTFHYCIVPHAGNWRDSPVLRVAAELNQSPYCLKESFHEGELAQSGSLVTIDCPNIVMSAFKPAHDGRGFILRCREAFGEHTNVRFMLSSIGCTFQALFTPFEIKTFRIEASSGENQWRITETNLLEFTPSEMERIASASRTPWEK